MCDDINTVWLYENLTNVAYHSLLLSVTHRHNKNLKESSDLLLKWIFCDFRISWLAIMHTKWWMKQEKKGNNEGLALQKIKGSCK